MQNEVGVLMFGMDASSDKNAHFQQKDNRRNPTLTRRELDGILLQYNAVQRTVIITDIVVRLTPIEFRLFTLLLENYKQPVPTATLIEQGLGNVPTQRFDRRLYRHIDGIRLKLDSLGLRICSVKEYGYVMLVDRTDERE